MNPPSFWAIASALAVVLGVVMVCAWLLRRLRGPGIGSSDVGRIEVLSRVGLAPRQGVATIRVAGRTAVVSYGDGGVRHVMDVLDADVAQGTESGARIESSTEDPGSRATDHPFAAVLQKAGRRVSGLRAMSLCVALLALPLAPMGLAAQDANEPIVEISAERAAAEAESEARQEAIRPEEAPEVALTIGSGNADEALKLSGPVGTVLFIGFMTLIPTLLLLMTGFTRILIVLHLLKQALGTQTAPPAHLLAAMALLLTGFVMAPTFEQVSDVALEPWMAGEIDELQMLKNASEPMRDFMLSKTRQQDLAAFVGMRGGPRPATVDDVPLVVVTSAFVTSELTSAFQMGFAVFLPFVVIDVVVASVLMSMGMFMLPPVMVSLPFKLLLFVLVDGWALVMGALVRSF